MIRDLIDPPVDEPQRVEWWINWAYDHDLTVRDFIQGMRELGVTFEFTLVDIE